MQELDGVADNISAAIEAGRELGKFETTGTVYRAGDGAVPFLVVQDGASIKTLEKHLAAPLAVRDVVTLHDAASFAAYVTRFRDAHTVVFADLEARRFEAVLDYHQAPLAGHPGAPRWGRHRAVFPCKTTPAWDEWTAATNNRKPKEQVEFARFIEEHIPHIAEPSGAQLLEMCLTLEAKKDVQFRASTRLADGQHQFRYEETIQGSAGAQAGQLAIPDAFTVAVEPFRGVGLRGIPARFRYRINSGALSMWYELVRPDDVLLEAFESLVAGLRTSLGETPVLVGTAPKASPGDPA